MTDLTLNSRTLLDHMALEERLRERISDIARACHLIREEGWTYRVKPGPYDRWHNLEQRQAYLESYETTETTLTAEFTFWWGDEREKVGVEFPLTYLDRPEADWKAEEQAVVDTLREQAEERAERAERKACEAQAHREKLARAKCVETIPGFEDLTPEAQAAILANITGA